MKFAGRLLARAQGGSIKPEDDSLAIENATEVVLLFTAATDYNLDKMNFDRSIDPGQVANSIVAQAAKKTWRRLLRDHLAEHRRYFDRVSIDLGHSPQDELPTNQRLVAIRKGAVDPGFSALYFQYGRYLLMASSRRPGRLPANLQGIWNDKTWAPWEADYHLNINLQMNYWPADVCNLAETLDPLADWFSRLTRRGCVTAKRLYETDGWVAYLATNPFGRVTPSGSTLASQFSNGVLDPLAGAWMAMTLWRHYEFSEDQEFLAGQAYPVLRGAAEFLLGYLKEDRGGNLVIVPSTSPENAYIHPESGKRIRITRGSTYHMTLVRVVFEAVIEGSRILDRDEALRERLEAALKKLPPMKIGANGTIQEWIEDYKEAEPKHRHVSHLLGLHPFAVIDRRRPELLEAARKTLERRGFGGDIGWSNAWKAAFFARLHDAGQAHWYLQRLFTHNTVPNLMDSITLAKKKRFVFQIDANFGGAAAIAEMLLQSQSGKIELLPALPAAWPKGKVTGLRARGAFEIDIEWAEGKLVTAKVKSLKGKPCVVACGGREVSLRTRAGETVRLDGDLRPVE
jgi:alpha-L-fucosidase 2